MQLNGSSERMGVGFTPLNPEVCDPGLRVFGGGCRIIGFSKRPEPAQLASSIGFTMSHRTRLPRATRSRAAYPVTATRESAVFRIPSAASQLCPSMTEPDMSRPRRLKRLHVQRTRSVGHAVSWRAPEAAGGHPSPRISALCRRRQPRCRRARGGSAPAPPHRRAIIGSDERAARL